LRDHGNAMFTHDDDNANSNNNDNDHHNHDDMRAQ
jgi:hypothetical protein